MTNSSRLRVWCLWLAAMGFTASGFCFSGVLTFDDLPSPGVPGLPMPSGYGDLFWDNFFYEDGAHQVEGGYLNGVISENNVIYNGFGNPTGLSGMLFNLHGAYATAAWNDDLQFEVQGFAGCALIYDGFYILNTAAPTWIQFNYLAVDRVVFRSWGGLNAGWDGSGTQFVLDDLAISEVPEPAGLTWILLMAVAISGAIFKSRSKARALTETRRHGVIWTSGLRVSVPL